MTNHNVHAPILIYNEHTQQKESFIPCDPGHVRMYTCGPTVYDLIHIGNARSLIVADIVYRVMKLHYNHVTHVRNITDIDDKIINKAQELMLSPEQIATRYTEKFHEDAAALYCITPSKEPKATDHINDIIHMINLLIDAKHAYVSNGHVFFDILSYDHYGIVANKNLSDLLDGVRIENTAIKNNPADFVLWKPNTEPDIISWESPWGRGRPGWHIECSAMSTKYLGVNFDIHCGGVDLKFPHHENEAAQSICSYPGSRFASYWIHNGSLNINNEKMSKSLNNSITVKQLLNNGIKGEVIRYVMLLTHYRKPMNWSEEICRQAHNDLNKIYNAMETYEPITDQIDNRFLSYINNDFNTHGAITILHDLVRQIHKTTDTNSKMQLQNILKNSANVIGLINQDHDVWFEVGNESNIAQLITLRTEYRKQKNFLKADAIRSQLHIQGIELFDDDNGQTTWKKIKN